jgi:hypothetical protein
MLSAIHCFRDLHGQLDMGLFRLAEGCDLLRISSCGKRGRTEEG